MSGRRGRMTALVNGPFRSANCAYRITSPRVAFDDTGFEDVRAEGRGQLSDEPVSVPVVVTARRVTGVGDVAGGILRNLRVQGVLKVTKRRLTGEGLTLTSDKLKGRSEEHTSELQSLMRISYAVFCLKKKKRKYIQSQK